MKKGQSPQLVVLVTQDEMLAWEEVQALREKGHTVRVVQDHGDLILGPECHLMTPPLRKYLPLAVREVVDRMKKTRHKGGAS